MIARFKRHLIQLLAALLYNLNFQGFATGTIYQGASKGICVPGLNCYSCPGAIGACPIGSLQTSLASSNQNLPFYIVGTLLAFGALLGRTVCGWLCPFGLIQDLFDKIPLPKIRKGTWSQVLSWGKYVILAVFVIILPPVLLQTTGVGTPIFCSLICPVGTLEAGIPLVAANSGLRAFLGALFNWKVTVLVVILVSCAFVYRPFCRFLCPLGALYSFFNRIALLRYRVDKSRCNGCNTCLAVCKLDIHCVSDRECIQCGACVSGCQQQAISFTLRDILAKRSNKK